MNKSCLYQLENFNVKEFLTSYWQQKPYVFRQVFKSFEDPLDEHELAGLAQEEAIDSRIISQHQTQWHVDFGPFDQFEHLCIGAWTLLVKGVNFHIPEVEALFDAFNFLPSWRKDDVMASYSNKNAGVGPHLDEYDVFIIQGQGTRRWQVGPVNDYQKIHPHPDLVQIEGFEPLIDEVLMPGDMIYIPPKFPHNGVALENCMNYSIGFRAPNQQELLTSLADYAVEQDCFSKRYRDPSINSAQDKYTIQSNEIDRLRHLLQQALDSKEFTNWIGAFTSGHHSVQTPDTENTENLSSKDLMKALNNGAVLIREPWTQPTYLEQHSQGTYGNDQSFIFFLGGTQYTEPTSIKQNMLEFLNAKSWSACGPVDACLAKRITEFVNAGYWYLDSDPE